MSLIYRSGPEEDAVVVDLKDPRIAALLGWLWPGAGHFYQRRFTKGFLFMVCIMSLFFYGMVLARGRCVYASMRPNDFRWQFFLQAGVGSPALVALVQAQKVKGGGDPLLVLGERYPNDARDPATGELCEFALIPAEKRDNWKGEIIRDGLLAPPRGPVSPQNNDVLGMWHAETGHFYELGMLFTIVAGALNYLAVYDAFAGPSILAKKKQDS
jgi:hypothetical protein